MRAILRIVMGGVYGYVCYYVLLWLIATSSPRLNLGGEHLIEALWWPLNLYQYVFPSHWAEGSTAENLFTVGGGLLILRGMFAAGKKVWRTAPY